MALRFTTRRLLILTAMVACLLWLGMVAKKQYDIMRMNDELLFGKNGHTPSTREPTQYLKFTGAPGSGTTRLATKS